MVRHAKFDVETTFGSRGSSTQFPQVHVHLGNLDPGFLGTWVYKTELGGYGPTIRFLKILGVEWENVPAIQPCCVVEEALR